LADPDIRSTYVYLSERGTLEQCSLRAASINQYVATCGMLRTTVCSLNIIINNLSSIVVAPHYHATTMQVPEWRLCDVTSERRRAQYDRA